MYIYFLFSIIIFALYIICTGNTNKEIIINVMLSTQSHGANATISSELHGASLCLANVVSGPWNIPSTKLCLYPQPVLRGIFKRYELYIVTNLQIPKQTIRLHLT